jgi:hypothetical protein
MGVQLMQPLTLFPQKLQYSLYTHLPEPLSRAANDALLSTDHRLLCIVIVRPAPSAPRRPADIF